MNKTLESKTFSEKLNVTLTISFNTEDDKLALKY